MAKRPIFVPDPSGESLAKEIEVEFQWFPGFSISQKQKSIRALHAASKVAPLLEISSKSSEVIGRRLSAFALGTEVAGCTIPLECAFQGSKVFENGGPFVDLHSSSPLDAKRDSRLRESGLLVRFQLENQNFPLEPKTFFYDWLYISTCVAQPDILEQITKFGGFTDIEFNPKKSINCQARSAALLVALIQSGMLTKAMQSPTHFASIVYSPR
jgi:hypothetical protein